MTAEQPHDPFLLTYRTCRGTLFPSASAVATGVPLLLQMRKSLHWARRCGVPCSAVAVVRFGEARGYGDFAVAAEYLEARQLLSGTGDEEREAAFETCRFYNPAADEGGAFDRPRSSNPIPDSGGSDVSENYADVREEARTDLGDEGSTDDGFDSEDYYSEDYYSEDYYGSVGSPSGAMTLAGQAGGDAPGGSVGGSSGNADNSGSSDESSEDAGQADWWDRERAATMTDPTPWDYVLGYEDWAYEPAPFFAVTPPVFAVLNPPAAPSPAADESTPDAGTDTQFSDDPIAQRYLSALNAADDRYHRSVAAARRDYDAALIGADGVRAGKIAETLNGYLRENADAENEYAQAELRIEQEFFATAAAAKKAGDAKLSDLDLRWTEGHVEAAFSAVDYAAFIAEMSRLEATLAAEGRAVAEEYGNVLIDAYLAWYGEMADAGSKYGQARSAAVAAFNEGIAAADDGWLESEETALADYEKAYWDAEWEWFLDVLEADADYETANADRAATPSVVTNVYSATAIQRALESGEGQVFGEVFVLTLPDGRKAVYQLRRPNRMTSRGGRPDFNQPKRGTLYGIYPAGFSPESAAEAVGTDQGQVNGFLELFPEMSEPTINRIGAVGQLGLATVEGVGAVVTAPSVAGTVVLGAAALDDGGTALVILWTGQPQRTVRNWAAVNTATFAGVPEEWAEGAGFAADIGPGLPAGFRTGAELYARHAARRAAGGPRVIYRASDEVDADRVLSDADAIELAEREGLTFTTRVREAGETVVRPPGANPGTDPPGAATVVVDARTAEVYRAVSGAGLIEPERVHMDLMRYYLQESNELWPVSNCAEFSALNMALHNGGKLEDFFVYTMRPGSRYRRGPGFGGRDGGFNLLEVMPRPLERCDNCIITTEGVTWIFPK